MEDRERANRPADRNSSLSSPLITTEKINEREEITPRLKSASLSQREQHTKKATHKKKGKNEKAKTIEFTHAMEMKGSVTVVWVTEVTGV